ncbi:MAG: GxxExxY protein [Flavobacteriales bacterium]|nr:GxxExxY protein [Flavobacteriales bacterium]MCB9191137.1 GxxExxY protein [Flavobacteriales bacterium]MCB9203483.1 GxxExxY protein [Flavobacteriales bacterium]
MHSEDELTGLIIGAAIEVHRELGPGLLESVYHTCLVMELEDLGLDVKTEIPMPVVYKGIKLDQGYRIDILVNDQVVVELKTVEKLTDVHTAQILTYMRLGDYPKGLLMNFKVKLLKNGIKRFVL